MTDSGRVFMPDESAKRHSAVSKADEEGAYEPEAPVAGVFENWRTWKKSVRFVNTQSETFCWGPKDETTGRHRDSGSVTGWVTIAPAKPDLETVAYRNPGLETREYTVNYTCPGGRAEFQVALDGAEALLARLEGDRGAVDRAQAALNGLHDHINPDVPPIEDIRRFHRMLRVMTIGAVLSAIALAWAFESEWFEVLVAASALMCLDVMIKRI